MDKIDSFADSIADNRADIQDLGRFFEKINDFLKVSKIQKYHCILAKFAGA